MSKNIDLKTKYVLNSFPYLSKNLDRPAGELQGEYVVKKLLKSYYNDGYIVCIDNFFTSFKLGVELLKKKTGFIGTMKKNKRELPSSINKTQMLYESLFNEHDTGMYLTIYQGKVDKNVCILRHFTKKFN